MTGDSYLRLRLRLGVRYLKLYHAFVSPKWSNSIFSHFSSLFEVSLKFQHLPLSFSLLILPASLKSISITINYTSSEAIPIWFIPMTESQHCDPRNLIYRSDNMLPINMRHHFPSLAHLYLFYNLINRVTDASICLFLHMLPEGFKSLSMPELVNLSPIYASCMLPSGLTDLLWWKQVDGLEHLPSTLESITIPCELTDQLNHFSNLKKIAFETPKPKKVFTAEISSQLFSSPSSSGITSIYLFKGFYDVADDVCFPDSIKHIKLQTSHHWMDFNNTSLLRNSLESLWMKRIHPRNLESERFTPFVAPNLTQLDLERYTVYRREVALLPKSLTSISIEMKTLKPNKVVEWPPKLQSLKIYLSSQTCCIHECFFKSLPTHIHLLNIINGRSIDQTVLENLPSSVTNFNVSSLFITNYFFRSGVSKAHLSSQMEFYRDPQTHSASFIPIIEQEINEVPKRTPIDISLRLTRPIPSHVTDLTLEHMKLERFEGPPPHHEQSASLLPARKSFKRSKKSNPSLSSKFVHMETFDVDDNDDDDEENDYGEITQHQFDYLTEDEERRLKGPRPRRPWDKIRLPSSLTTLKIIHYRSVRGDESFVQYLNLPDTLTNLKLDGLGPFRGMADLKRLETVELKHIVLIDKYIEYLPRSITQLSLISLANISEKPPAHASIIDRLPRLKTLFYQEIDLSLDEVDLLLSRLITLTCENLLIYEIPDSWFSTITPGPPCNTMAEAIRRVVMHNFSPNGQLTVTGSIDLIEIESFQYWAPLLSPEISSLSFYNMVPTDLAVHSPTSLHSLEVGPSAANYYPPQLSSFPRFLTKLDLQYDGFWTIDDLINLPPNLTWLNLIEADDFGSEKVQLLPTSLTHLSLTFGCSDGEMLSYLPKNLTYLNISDYGHSFSPRNLSNLPPSIQFLRILMTRNIDAGVDETINWLESRGSMCYFEESNGPSSSDPFGLTRRVRDEIFLRIWNKGAFEESITHIISDPNLPSHTSLH
jgi:hypothetical protein